MKMKKRIAAAALAAAALAIPSAALSAPAFAADQTYTKAVDCGFRTNLYGHSTGNGYGVDNCTRSTARVKIHIYAAAGGDRWSDCVSVAPGKMVGWYSDAFNYPGGPLSRC